MTKIAIEQYELTDKERLKLEVMQLKGQLRKIGIKDVFTFFKHYNPNYPVNKFRSCYNTQQADKDFNKRLQNLIDTLKKQK